MTEKIKKLVFCVPEGDSKLIWDKDDGIAEMIQKVYIKEYHNIVDNVHAKDIRKEPIRKTLTKDISFTFIDKLDGLHEFGFGDPDKQDPKTNRLYTKFMKYIFSRLMKNFKNQDLVMKIYDVLEMRLRFIPYGTHDSWDTNKNLRKAVIKAYNIVIKGNSDTRFKELKVIQSSISELEFVHKYITLKLKLLKQQQQQQQQQ